MWDLLRHQRRPGVLLGRCGRKLESDCARFAGSAERGGTDAEVALGRDDVRSDQARASIPPALEVDSVRLFEEVSMGQQSPSEIVRQASTFSILWGVLLIVLGVLAIGSPLVAAV